MPIVMVTERDAPAAGRLAGKRVLVTGAARGIGAAIAERFAAEGAKLALLDREGDQCRSTAERLGAFAIDIDLADPASAREATQAAIDSLGGVDVLVNNAGILHMAPLLDITVEDWDLTFDINVRAMLLTTQVAARAMIAAGAEGRSANGGGAIVNMASMGGKVGSPNQAHYAASKAAVISLTRVSAMERKSRIGICSSNKFCNTLRTTPSESVFGTNSSTNFGAVFAKLLSNCGASSRPINSCACVCIT